MAQNKSGGSGLFKLPGSKKSGSFSQLQAVLKQQSAPNKKEPEKKKAAAPAPLPPLPTGPTSFNNYDKDFADLDKQLGQQQKDAQQSQTDLMKQIADMEAQTQQQSDAYYNERQGVLKQYQQAQTELQKKLAGLADKSNSYTDQLMMLQMERQRQSDNLDYAPTTDAGQEVQSSANKNRLLQLLRSSYRPSSLTLTRNSY